MKLKSYRIALVGLLVAAAAHPALAGVVYVPAANVTEGGISRTGYMYLSNQDVTSVRGVQYRFIQAGVAGTPIPTGSLPTAWLLNGVSSAIAPTNVPAGQYGMLEVSPGRTDMVVSSRMVYGKAGVYQIAVDMPAVSSQNVLAANSTAYVQGIEHGSTSGILTDLGLMNLSSSAAACTVNIYSGANGTAIASNLAVNLAALSSTFYADFFGGNNPIEVPAHSWMKVSCNAAFYVFGVHHNSNTGHSRVLLPTVALDQSTFVAGGDGSGGGGGGTGQNDTTITLPGTFLTCTSGNKFWKVSLSNPTVAGKTYKRIQLDVDVFHNNWDPAKTVHIYVWLQNGQSWSSGLFSYIVAVKGQNKFKMQIRYGRNDAIEGAPGPQVGNSYHAYFDWNGNTRQVTYRITRDGSTITNRTASLSKGSFVVNGMFVGLGSWPTGHGPEALQYGWRYSNLKVVYSN
ncbi:MAG: hypothetical protein AMXMBFR36_23810 [Acidobacteriota bacterium]